MEDGQIKHYNTHTIIKLKLKIDILMFPDQQTNLILENYL